MHRAVAVPAEGPITAAAGGTVAALEVATTAEAGVEVTMVEEGEDGAEEAAGEEEVAPSAFAAAAKATTPTHALTTNGDDETAPSNVEHSTL